MQPQCAFALSGLQNESAKISINESTKNGTGDELLEMVDDFDLELVRYEHYQTMIPILLIMCFLAILINITVLVISSRSKKPVSLTLKLTLGLAAADIYTSAILGAGLYLHSYLLYVQCFIIPHYFCIAFVVESLRLGAILTSVLHLLLLAINHYRKVPTKRPPALIYWT